MDVHDYFMDFIEQDVYNIESQYIEGDMEVKLYTADFETTTDLDDCRVWAFAVCEMDNPDHVIYGNSIESFFELCKVLPDCRMYFHNLAFDVAFIFDYMLRNNYRWEDDRIPRYTYGFTTVISNMNQVYAVRVNLGDGHTVQFWDSMKVIPLSIAQEARAFGLEEGKGSIDYRAYRAPGHVLTDEEKDYIRRDVQIDAHAMNFMLDMGLSKMTIGSCALYDFKKGLGGSKPFRYNFPVIKPEDDAFMRKAYRGGFTYVNPKYAGKELGEGISYDVNSLYPSVMASCDDQLLPYGKPEWFYGEPKPDSNKPLWIARVRLSFRIIQGHIPCIQLKGNMSFLPTEYVTDSKGDVVITITSVDWALIVQQYHVTVHEWYGGYRFKGSKIIFKRYVDKWVEVKNRSTVEGNKGMRQIAKLMLNSLYGKFATQIEVRSRKPVLELQDHVRYVDIPSRDREPVYLPAGCFITAYARYKTITSAQMLGDRFIYSDTDSLKVLGTEPVEDLDIDEVRLGAWKDEGHFTRFKALRAKTYIAEYDGNIVVHVAGLPSRCHSQVTFDNFELGATYEGKLYQHRVAGGIVLVEDTFTIKGA